MAVLRAGAPLKQGTFVVVSLLGRGGFGEVYLARQPRMNRDVAIKVLSPNVAEEPDIVRRFEREALAAGSLLHPNVLPVFDFDYDEEAGVWFLAMQYIPGGRTLQSLLGTPMDPAEVANIIAAIASALEAAHDRGIVHRDVKPANVLLDGQRPMLTDFGIAHLGSLTGITARGMAIGTPAYVSPEQGMGKEVGPASDQYSLAVMAYEMLAGRPPFTGDSVSLVIQHVSNPPTPITSINPAIPEAVAMVVGRALRKKPEDRFPSCVAFAEALTAAVAGKAPPVEEEAVAPPIGPSAPTIDIESGALPVATGAATVGPEAYLDLPPTGVISGRGAPAAAVVAAPPGPAPVSIPLWKRPVALAGAGAIVVLLTAGVAAKQILAPSASGDLQARPASSPVAGGASPVAGTAAPASPNRGTLVISSNPNAALIVNDESYGRTPLQANLDPGEYDIKLVASTYEDWTSHVQITAGQRLTVPPVDLVPKPAIDVIGETDKKVGRDPFVDSSDIIRLTTTTQNFRVSDDVNAVVYLSPKTFGIRDLTFKVTLQWEKAGGGPPAVQSADQTIQKDWEQTFIHACAPASVLDPTGSNVPLSLSIAIDDTPLESFSYQIGPGSLAGVESQCNKKVLPRTQARAPGRPGALPEGALAFAEAR
ncbi:MAG TPA: serine/threonine-protein kinase [Chloroflexota bacterium]|nr:serine/threonine-protein kinase [Chloroflexota bacterium]